ncbi:modifier of mdg4-like [Rhagoletis pomonella]|uniref:modifier of mdg4-like n=1 Tax=Rhagoletis pomonella TaxID=28610 RepID=UPI00177CC30F|nr:modifier of mdg4-like [Rhagoletis pomonella]XP_036323582.1 modifier of mdg4-like [Rhagoletis pomonella]
MATGALHSVCKTSPGNENQSTTSKGKRGRPPKQPRDDRRLVDKVLAAVQQGPGEPALYASTTKGGMKLIYEGHHFRFTFRRGRYSIFQCCFKENMQECKVRVVTDQKRVFPLDGEHVHFMQATDKSVTSMTFEPAGLFDDDDSKEQEHNAAYEEGTDSTQVNESQEFLSETNEVSTVETADSSDTNDFREKIKRRLQKALLGKKK